MMQFVLTGFKQDMESRVFTFDGVAADRSRVAFTIRADLTLARKYGIQTQELPLLCRGLLERASEGEQSFTMTFTEEEMRLYQGRCAELRDAALQKRKAARRFVPLNVEAGTSWRGMRDGKTAPAEVETSVGRA